ncbi:hypothetical protein CGLO_12300 [Colletotrichum gloeosporioides Cg-14]|uniref:Uncharacterized protein n=1 Tax=Colletotrichum gloeosporioides (strain Cg-14) TaxID=1237896 RepID=T0K905_COLGC|nr:hypothetical protein CGLO_12300 [Colletotrichum gloeosporioides Cg-14]
MARLSSRVTETPPDHYQPSVQQFSDANQLQQVICGQNHTIGQLQAEIHRLRTREMHGYPLLGFPPNDVLNQQQAVVISNLKGENSRLHGDNASLNQELQQSHAVVMTHKDVIEQSHQQAVELADRIVKLQQDLEQQKKNYEDKVEKHCTCIKGLRNENNLLKQQLTAQASSQLTEPAFANSKKVSDDEIVAIWKTMAYNIRSLAATMLVHCPSQQSLKPGKISGKCALAQMSQEHYQLLKDADMRSGVVEKYLWKSVANRILRSGDAEDLWYVWGGLFGTEFFDVFQEMSEHDMNPAEFEELLRWKSQGAAMIEKTIGIDKAALKDLVKTETEGFLLLSSPETQKDPKAHRDLFVQLGKIYKEALQLSSIFMTSKAHFIVGWAISTQQGNQKVPYNKEFMEAEGWENEPTDKSIVALDVSPGLMKYGTANGSAYGKCTMLVKHGVVLN